MNCQQCGYEIQSREVYCGQCGAPSPDPGIVSTEEAQQPARSVDINVNGSPGKPPVTSFIATASRMRALPSRTISTSLPHSEERMQQEVAGSMTPPPQISSALPTPQLKHNADTVHADETEVITSPGPQSPHIPHQDFPGTSLRDFAQAPHHHAPVFAEGHHPRLSSPLPGYRPPLKPALPPQKQQHTAIVLIVAICMVIALVSIIGVITSALPRGTSQPTTNNQADRTPAAPPTPTQAIPTPTPALTPTPVQTPTPTLTPTPLPDSGFAWCSTYCQPYSFNTEYPLQWQLGTLPQNNGVQFSNPAQPEQQSMFLALGATTSSAGDHLNYQLQTVYASKPGYTPPPAGSIATATIGGETWVATNIYFQGSSQQRQRLAIFATVHQGKAYLIELLAPDPDGQQFNQVYSTYYLPMLQKYQFL